MNKLFINNRQRGFTLVEILVALAIGALLTVGFVQIFSGSKKTYLVQDNLSRLQENGRFAMDFLSQDIRMAGFRQNATPANPFTDDAIRGFEGSGSFNSNIGDAIEIRYEADRNCVGNDPNTVGAKDGIARNVFFIKDGELKCRGNGQTEPLVEGMEDMQILYGEDTTPTDDDYTANRYLPAGAVDMDNVVSVRITLSVRTLDDHLALQDSTNPSGGTDRRLRQTFTKTISLRNRIP